MHVAETVHTSPRWAACESCRQTIALTYSPLCAISAAACVTGSTPPAANRLAAQAGPSWRSFGQNLGACFHFRSGLQKPHVGFGYLHSNPPGREATGGAPGFS